MKDEAHHMKHVQKKVLQEYRKEQAHLKSKEKEIDQKARQTKRGRF